MFDELSQCRVLARTFGLRSGRPAPNAPAELFQRYCQAFFDVYGACDWEDVALIDYVWFIDEGEVSGPHLHVLFFYGSILDRDAAITDELDEIWGAVTDNTGRTWSSYAGNVFHEERGYGICTGDVDRADYERREVLCQNIRYMARASQFLSMRHWRHCQLFGTSQEQRDERAQERAQLPCDVRQIGDADTDPTDLYSSGEADEDEGQAQCAAGGERVEA